MVNKCRCCDWYNCNSCKIVELGDSEGTVKCLVHDKVIYKDSDYY